MIIIIMKLTGDEESLVKPGIKTTMGVDSSSLVTTLSTW
jgi:hypothetical protein